MPPLDVDVVVVDVEVAAKVLDELVVNEVQIFNFLSQTTTYNHLQMIVERKKSLKIVKM
jgi:hypothetical protein